MNIARRVLNRSLDYLLFNPFMEFYWAGRMHGKVSCLLYHRVDDSGDHTFLQQGGIPVTSPAELRADIEFLRKLGVRFLTLSDLEAGEYPGQREIGIIISFDDGFSDNYTLALDLLGEFNIKSVIFQSSALVENKQLIWEHALYWHCQDVNRCARLREAVTAELVDADSVRSLDGMALAAYLRENVSGPLLDRVLLDLGDDDALELQQRICSEIYPNEQMLREASSAGHDIGSHGHHHYKRANISDDLFERELVESRERLTRVFGTAPTQFSYPFNSYKAGDDQRCARYFKQVATVDGGLISPDYDPLSIPRVTWPGPARNELRRRRWLTTGAI